MRIIILTHDNDRHFYFCNEIIKNTNQVVGVITGAKNKKLSKNKKKKIYKNHFFSILRNKLLNLIFFKSNKKLFDEKKYQEKLFFNNEKSFFSKNYNELVIAEYNESHDSINDDYYVSLIRSKNPDVILVMGTCLLGKKIINSCKHVINMHTGLSPYYRGGWTNLFPIINKDFGFFGVTIHKMSTGIDSGDIIFTRRPNIDITDNYSSINCKAIVKGVELMIRTIELIKENKMNSTKQWTKGRLFYGRSYNGFIAFLYFIKLKKFISRYCYLQDSNLLPRLTLIENGIKNDQ
ncbi:MAG: hypothetical protein CMG62_10045 [Candidatus Marinimicrobia bacterium]|nr:hypothetical protein [Candidatus Neomarinimicrobiota bacterium]|tara:strand:+ start:1001 stop:1876 length:876 start_codon:yes stop_codon:yes gene_type:complete